MATLRQRVIGPLSQRLQQRIDASIRRVEVRLDALEGQRHAHGLALDRIDSHLGALREEIDEARAEAQVLGAGLARAVATLKHLSAPRSAAGDGVARLDENAGDDGRLKVAVVASLYAVGDGISASVRPKLRLIRELRSAEIPIEVTLFVRSSDVSEPGVVTIPSLAELLMHPAFLAADLLIFEFGHFYDLFDGVLAAPERARIAAVYHNITPVELSADPLFRRRILLSFMQKEYLRLADRILCVSRYNLDDLVHFGIPPERLAVASTPPAIVPPDRRPRGREPIELLFVGRIIPAKGVLDLVRAFSMVVEEGITGIRLTIAGNRAFASPECLQEIDALAEGAQLGERLRIIHPGDEELGRLYASSDLLVMPSRHEGFCVPVIEALSGGCQVIASDAGALPDTLGGLGTLVRVGDVDQLAGAISDFVHRAAEAAASGQPMLIRTAHGLVTEREWQLATKAHLESHSLRAFRVAVMDLLTWAAEENGRRAVADGLRAFADRSTRIRAAP